MNERGSLSGRAETYRLEFDRSFALPPQSVLLALEDFLAIRVGQDAYAVRLSGFTGLLRDQNVVSIPGPLPELLGLAGVRGSLCPVYDLAATMGYAGTQGGPWILLTQGPEVIGFAFARFEGHLRAGAEAIQAGQEAGSAREILRTEGEARPILDVSSLTGKIRQRVDQLKPQS